MSGSGEECCNGSGYGNGSGYAEIRMPAEDGLYVVFGAVAVGLLVLAVVLVVCTTLCHRRLQRTKPYYSFRHSVTVQPRESQTKDSVRSNAELPDLRLDGLKSMEEGESVELVETLTQSAYSEAPLITTSEPPQKERELEENQERRVEEESSSSAQDKVVCEGEGSGKGSLAGGGGGGGKKSRSQFSFEDGTSLHDYPASVDLEVSGGDEEEPQRANIIGYCDIYSSHILFTLPTTEDPAHTHPENKDYIKSPRSSAKRLKRRTPAVDPSSQAVAAAGLVGVGGRGVPGHGRQRPISTPCLPDSLPHPFSPDMSEVENLLNQSLTDVLEMTEAIAREDQYNNSANYKASDGATFEPEVSMRTMQRQASSLPSLLEPPTPSPTSHLPPLPSNAGANTTAAQGAPSIVVTKVPESLEPGAKTLLYSDEMTELQISRV